MREEDATSNDTTDQRLRPGRQGEAISPIVAEAATRVIDILRNQGRTRLEDAAKWTRRRLELHQSSKDIEALYGKLGRELVCLVEAGEVAHPGLMKRAARIREEEASYAAARNTVESASGADRTEE